MGLLFSRSSAVARASFPSALRVLPLAYPWWKLGVAGGVLLTIGVLAAGIGPVVIPPSRVAGIVLDKAPFFHLDGGWPDAWNTIIWQIRFPRIVLAGLVGAALAISGATYQGLFRNPLADPYLIGVAAGAGLGATIVLVTSVPLFFFGVSILPPAAFAGALLAVALAYLVAKHSRGLPLTTLILAGVAIASLAGAATGFLMIRASPDVRPLLAWLMGGFVGVHWEEVRIVMPYLIPGVLGMLAYGRVLNVMQLGEEEAQHLGVNVERTKLVLIALASLTVAAAVSVSGPIGFVGLVAPHAIRLVWGHDHRFLLPMSIFVGAGFLILADLVARTVASPTELPVGLVTAFCGAPFFLYLLLRSKGATL